MKGKTATLSNATTKEDIYLILVDMLHEMLSWIGRE